MILLTRISEDDYEVIKEVNELSGKWKTDISSRIMECIANGVPLNKLSDELITFREGIKDNNVLIGYNMAISILNKYSNYIK